MKFLAALVAATLAAFPCLAQQPECGERADLLTLLEQKYGERPVSFGLSNRGVVLEITASDSGSWTFLVTDGTGKTCVVDVGEGWTILPPDKKSSL